MIVSLLKYAGLYILIILIQLYILNNVFIGNFYAFLFQPQLIIMFILLLPPGMPHTWLVLVSFLAGFVFDVFFQSWGVHAAVATLVGFVRHYATRDIENVIAAREEENQIWTSKKGSAWKWTYFLTFIAIYHFLFLLLDSMGHNFFTRLIPSFISSTLIAFALILVLENLIYKPARN
jgi:rod shape-determining protein MreD